MLSRWCILSQMPWQRMSAYWERQIKVKEQQWAGPSQNFTKWLRSSSAPSLMAPLKIAVHILIPAPSPRNQVSSQRKQLGDWKHVEDQGRAPRTGSIVKKSWLELKRTDRPHQRNMAVRVALNQSVGQTEKCQDCPPDHIQWSEKPSKTLFYFFLIRHFQKTGGTVQEEDQHLLFNEALELVKAS